METYTDANGHELNIDDAVIVPDPDPAFPYDEQHHSFVGFITRFGVEGGVPYAIVQDSEEYTFNIDTNRLVLETD